VLVKLKGINLGQLTGLINNKTKLAAILELEASDDQLKDWDMPYVDLTWSQYWANFSNRIAITDTCI